MHYSIARQFWKELGIHAPLSNKNKHWLLTLKNFSPIIHSELIQWDDFLFIIWAYGRIETIITIKTLVSVST